MKKGAVFLRGPRNPILPVVKNIDIP